MPVITGKIFYDPFCSRITGTTMEERISNSVMDKVKLFGGSWTLKRNPRPYSMIGGSDFSEELRALTKHRGQELNSVRK
jgi:hypothetical protein